MEFIKTPFEGLYLIEAKKIVDKRGEFARTYCKKEFDQIGMDKEFVQFNHSLNYQKGTIRGMHYQRPPYAEIKLIRCTRGRVYDVAVDLRKHSSTYMKHFSVELSEDNLVSVMIPEGFAHGFQALEDNATLIYHHTQYYTPGSDSGVCFDDPTLKIAWPLVPINISEKDRTYELIDNNFEGIEL